MKHFLFLVLVLTFFTACKSTSPITNSKKADPKKQSIQSEKRKAQRLVEQLIDAAAENIGVKYRYGGTTKSGFDCSGLMVNIFDSNEISLPRTSIQQSKHGIILDHEQEKAKKGDLIFFKTNRNRQINHVGIVIEVNEDEIKFIHASTSRGVMISSTKEVYYKTRFAQLNRIL
ncbi:NlpC/P60 family protein [Flavobacterium sp. GSP27]|uniref:C40 family peptidase n=1 Tax=Flavobacterium sp. GSP27 TaxID=2497489 RepID=UPI000F825389|nr:C40 family peptidase [Flavobacterium sp. GSP27]RTZ08304.1 NlpC/P60 family protein [Flavobacterium sp. GSP27]